MSRGAAPDTIGPGQCEVNEIYEALFSNDAASDSPSATAGASALGDEEVIAKARNATNAGKFLKLWEGDASGQNNDASAADLALCGILAFFTNRDPNQIDRLFRKSKLFRSKWDRSDYRDRTIEKAIAGCKKVFTAFSAARLRTDYGNSDRLVDQHGETIRYDHRRRRWYYFNGARWEPDFSGNIQSLTKNVICDLLPDALKESDTAKRNEMIKFALACQSSNRTTAAIELARDKVAISPDQFDIDPYLLNCLNGTLNLRDGKLREHRSEDFLTKICSAAYDPAGKCPRFLRFINEIMQGDPELVAYIQRVFGYAITGDTKEQVLFFLYGLGANGKSTLTASILNVLADYAGVAAPDLIMAKKQPAHLCELVDLQGRRAVVCSEPDESKRFDEARLKDLTGETRMKARGMFENLFEFTITHKIFLLGNHRPVIRGTDHGIWRRIHLIPFLAKFSDVDRDADLLTKLKAESPGILAWCVAGALAWQREGLNPPAIVTAATAAYRTEMDVLGSFIEARCNLGESFSVNASALYETFKDWARSAGEFELSQTAFGKKLGDRGFRSRRGHVTTWHGLTLKTRGEGPGLRYAI